MKRIKDLEKIILKEDEILAEVFYKKSLIIQPNKGATDDFDYCKVIASGTSVNDIVKGDVLLQINGGDGFEIGDRLFIVVRRYYIGVAVKPDNFDIGKSPNVN